MDTKWITRIFEALKLGGTYFAILCTQFKNKRQISITVLHFLIKNLKIMLFTSPTRTNKKETQELQKKRVTVSRAVHCPIGSQPLHWKCLFWKYRLSDPGTCTKKIIMTEEQNISRKRYFAMHARLTKLRFLRVKWRRLFFYIINAT